MEKDKQKLIDVLTDIGVPFRGASHPEDEARSYVCVGDEEYPGALCIVFHDDEYVGHKIWDMGDMDVAEGDEWMGRPVPALD